jgi:hypothetical protein
VMAAVQVMRGKAQTAGNLRTTPQQTVEDQGSNIVIQPAQPDVVYVPEYDPELCYGYPVPLWPGFYPWWGVSTPFLSFGVGFPIGPFFGFGWGRRSWGFDWGHHGIFYHGGMYGYRSHAFYDRNAYFHGGFRGPGGFAPGDRGMRGYPGGEGSRGGGARPGGGPGGGAARPGGEPAGHPGGASRPSAFGGVRNGGESRGFSSRGMSSFHGGGGGFHGGGRSR